MKKIQVLFTEQELNIAQFAVMKLMQQYQRTVAEAEAPRGVMVEAIAQLSAANNALKRAK